jgi:hypothetical protein
MVGNSCHGHRGAPCPPSQGLAHTQPEFRVRLGHWPGGRPPGPARAAVAAAGARAAGGRGRGPGSTSSMRPLHHDDSELEGPSPLEGHSARSPVPARGPGLPVAPSPTRKRLRLLPTRKLTESEPARARRLPAADSEVGALAGQPTRRHRRGGRRLPTTGGRSLTDSEAATGRSGPGTPT